MPKIEEWLALEHTEETPHMVRLFERRPEWLATGRLDQEVLVWFDSDWPGLPLYLDYEEFTVGWNVAHDHLLWSYRDAWPPADVVEIAIDMIEAVLEGRLLRLYAETPQGRWQTAGFVAPDDMEAQIAQGEAKGWDVTIHRWPGKVVYRTARAVIAPETPLQ